MSLAISLKVCLISLVRPFFENSKMVTISNKSSYCRLTMVIKRFFDWLLRSKFELLTPEGPRCKRLEE